jgi:hypothetical protein
LQRFGKSSWTKDEMQICTRYALAVLMQRVQQNHALAAEVASF